MYGQLFIGCTVKEPVQLWQLPKRLWPWSPFWSKIHYSTVHILFTIYSGKIQVFTWHAGSFSLSARHVLGSSGKRGSVGDYLDHLALWVYLQGINGLLTDGEEPSPLWAAPFHQLCLNHVRVNNAGWREAGGQQGPLISLCYWLWMWLMTSCLSSCADFPSKTDRNLKL